MEILYVILGVGVIVFILTLVILWKKLRKYLQAIIINQEALVMYERERYLIMTLENIDIMDTRNDTLIRNLYSGITTLQGKIAFESILKKHNYVMYGEQGTIDSNSE